jgi:hypothetical protein
VLPDDRIFGQITQNRHKKSFWLEKNGGCKTVDFPKPGRKEAEKYVIQIYEETPSIL